MFEKEVQPIIEGLADIAVANQTPKINQTFEMMKTPINAPRILKTPIKKNYSETPVRESTEQKKLRKYEFGGGGGLLVYEHYRKIGLTSEIKQQEKQLQKFAPSLGSKDYVQWLLNSGAKGVEQMSLRAPVRPKSSIVKQVQIQKQQNTTTKFGSLTLQKKLTITEQKTKKLSVKLIKLNRETKNLQKQPLSSSKPSSVDAEDHSVEPQVIPIKIQKTFLQRQIEKQARRNKQKIQQTAVMIPDVSDGPFALIENKGQQSAPTSESDKTTSQESSNEVVNWRRDGESETLVEAPKTLLLFAETWKDTDIVKNPKYSAFDNGQDNYLDFFNQKVQDQKSRFSARLKTQLLNQTLKSKLSDSSQEKQSQGQVLEQLGQTNNEQHRKSRTKIQSITFNDNRNVAALAKQIQLALQSFRPLTSVQSRIQLMKSDSQCTELQISSRDQQKIMGPTLRKKHVDRPTTALNVERHKFENQRVMKGLQISDSISEILNEDKIKVKIRPKSHNRKSQIVTNEF